MSYLERSLLLCCNPPLKNNSRIPTQLRQPTHHAPPHHPPSPLTILLLTTLTLALWDDGYGKGADIRDAHFSTVLGNEGFYAPSVYKSVIQGTDHIATANPGFWTHWVLCG
ncbi:hypothetical protein ABVK25_001568 [Lepraria finkii]|uniref:Uncharacterized protein n=1 Tax=Lepraria finkii TaxID=1340010 RepID=A0ABR4BLN9_9LECA